jgi:hypothetical protein
MDTVRALRQVIMFKEVPEPVLKIVSPSRTTLPWGVGGKRS